MKVNLISKFIRKFFELFEAIKWPLYLFLPFPPLSSSQCINQSEHGENSEVMAVLNMLYHSVEEKFEGMGGKAVSSILFLRVICPVLVSPSQNAALSKSKGILPFSSLPCPFLTSCIVNNSK